MLEAVRARRVLTLAGIRPFSSGGPQPLSAPVDNLSSQSALSALAGIDNGVIVAEDGIIIDVLPYTQAMQQYDISPLDLGEVTLVPALVNAHTHLELSHLRGRAVFGLGFEEWIESLLPQMIEEVDTDSLDAAITHMRETGTGHVADVCGRTAGIVEEFAARRGLSCQHQMEVFGYHFPDGFSADKLWPSAVTQLTPETRKRRAVLAGHALYSTHPLALVFAKQWCRSQKRHFSMHLAEHKGEEELLLKGTGRLKDQLSRRVLPPDFTAPSLRPVPYAAELGLLDEGTLAVHCVQCNEADIALLAENGVNVCLCPRSNRFIGVGKAPVKAMLKAGINLCLGTDSLSSNQDLNLWYEARELRATDDISADVLLRMMTVNGAHALNVRESFGSLEKGKHFRYAIVPDDFA